jgi:hypothetical protein
MRAILLAIAIGVSGCGAIAFDVEQAIQEQTIQGSPLGGLLPAFLPTPFRLSIDVKSETQKRSTGPATSAGLKAISFSTTPRAMPSGTFDFVDEIHIFIAASGNASLPKVEIATLKPVPKGLTTLELVVVPGIDLLPYVNAGAEVSAQASGTQPTQTVTFDGKVVVTIRI